MRGRATAPLLALCFMTVVQVQVQLLCQQPVLAEGFPGKGSASAWGDALPYYNRGNRYLNRGRFEDAVNDYNEAIAKYPFDPDFYINLGVAYRKLEDYANEERCFKKALALNDQDWMSWNDLANAYLKQNKLKEAIATYQTTLKLNPPAAQKKAIEGDIADITKILRMNGELPDPKIVKDSRTANSSKTPAGSMHRIQSGQKQSRARERSAARLPPAPGLRSTSAPDLSDTGGGAASAVPAAGAAALSKKSLEGSGWDYVYKR